MEAELDQTVPDANDEKAQKTSSDKQLIKGLERNLEFTSQTRVSFIDMMIHERVASEEKLRAEIDALKKELNKTQSKLLVIMNNNRKLNFRLAEAVAERDRT